MERTVYASYSEYISMQDIDCVESIMKPEELKEFKQKSALLSNMIFESFESKCFAEKMFYMGYMAAHIDLPKGQL